MIKYNIIIIAFLLFSLLKADDVINDTQKSIIDNTYKKTTEDALYEKNSWINPAYLETSISKSNTLDTQNMIETRQVSINIDQEIFRSGAILDTISKGKNLKNLSHLNYIQQKKHLLSLIYGLVIDLKSIDLNIKKLTLLITNQNLIIDKKSDLYNYGLIDISELDESIIELSELKNQIEDLNIEKVEKEKELKRYSNKKYKEITLKELSNVEYDFFINNNSNILTKSLEVKDLSFEKNIVKSSFLPTLSLYGSYGYGNTQYQESEDFYQYGLKLTIPLDFNFKTLNQSAKLKYIVANTEFQEIRKNEENNYKMYIEHLSFIKNKITNTNEIIQHYQSIYETALNKYQNSLKTIEDVKIIKNRVETKVIDKDILELDKKVILNSIFERLLIK